MTKTLKRALVVGINFAPESTGIAPYTSGLVDMLIADKWDVEVITTVPHYPAWKIDSAGPPAGYECLASGARVRRIRPDIPKKLTQLGRVKYEILFGIRAVIQPWSEPDVLVLVTPALFSTAIALIKARLFNSGTRVVVWVQDFYSLGVKETNAGSGLATRLISALESWVLRRANHVVVIHDRFAKHAIEGLGAKMSRVTVIRNWTHIRPVRVDRDAARARFGWSNQIIVLHAGNMGAKQGLENVVEAARIADAGECNVLFVLLGGGNRREALLDAAVGVRRIVFMDSLGPADFGAALQAADILLVNELPGVQEMAVPSKLTSYYSAVRPVLVASDAGSITSEEIETSGGGIRVDAGDAEALLEAALELGADPARSDSLARKGFAFQLDVLSADGAARAFRRLLQP